MPAFADDARRPGDPVLARFGGNARIMAWFTMLWFRAGYVVIAGDPIPAKQRRRQADRLWRVMFCGSARRPGSSPLKAAEADTATRTPSERTGGVAASPRRLHRIAANGARADPAR